MNVQIFGPERKTGEVLVLEKISRLVWKHHGNVWLMDDTAFLATWDDTDKFGFVNLTKAELKDFTASTGSRKKVSQEILMETNNLVLRLTLKFDIYCMVSEDRRVLQIEEDQSHDTNYAMVEAESPEQGGTGIEKKDLGSIFFLRPVRLD